MGEWELGVERCEDGAWGACTLDYDPAEHPETCDGLGEKTAATGRRPSRARPAATTSVLFEYDDAADCP